MKEIKRGEIWLVDLGSANGSIQGFTRPVIVVSNNMACKHSSVINVVPVTGQLNKKWIPTHIDIPTYTGVLRPSIALCEQIQLLDKDLFQKKVGFCNDYIMDRVDTGMMIQLGLHGKENKNIS